jgi:hypothetical protein
MVMKDEGKEEMTSCKVKYFMLISSSVIPSFLQKIIIFSVLLKKMPGHCTVACYCLSQKFKEIL